MLQIYAAYLKKMWVKYNIIKWIERAASFFIQQVKYFENLFVFVVKLVK